LANTSANSFVIPSDERAAAAGEPFAQYAYDPRQARSDLADGGWRPAADGHIVNAAGERVTLPLRTTVEYPQEAEIMADYWRQVGFDVVEETASAAQTQNSEYKATFPGFYVAGRTNNEAVLPYFDSRQVAAPANHWSSANVMGYVNPRFDALLDQLN